MNTSNKPLYTRIIDDYKNKILSGELMHGDKLPSESDLAKQFGVSRITSKRAMEELFRDGLIYRLKGSGSYVSGNISDKKEVLSNKMKVFGMIIPFDSSLGRSMDLIHGASDYLRKKKYLLSVHISEFNVQKEREILKEFASHGVQGVILYPVYDRLNLDILYELILEKFPIVTVDKYIDGLPIQAVLSDNFGGAYEAVNYFINKGHKHIGFISDLGLGDSVTVRDRFFGYSKALKDSNLIIKEEYCRIDFINEMRNKNPELVDILLFRKSINKECMDFFKEILDRMMNCKDPVTALFALNDYVAIMVLKTALAMGIKIPQQLSLIGHDNIESSQHVEVPLTTVEQNLFQMGYEAARALVKKASGELSINTNRVNVLPTRIIERKSVFDLNTLQIEVKDA